MRMRELYESKKIEPSKPRNFVAKNARATTSGAGAHKDKKKAMKQGDVKHKGKEMAEARANTASARASLAKRNSKAPLSPEEQRAKDKAKSDKWLEKERAKQQSKVKEGTDIVPSQNPTDTVEMDVPLMIRLFEYAREDAKTDMDLHDVAERLIQLSAEGRTLTMSDYNAIVGSSKESMGESATAGATSAANVSVGAVYPNKPPKQPKAKNGTAKNALDMKGTNLLTGGSIKR